MRVQAFFLRHRLAVLGLILAVMVVFAFTPYPAQAAATAPISTKDFVGTFTIDRFVTQTIGGVQQLLAVGTVNGTTKTGQSVTLTNVRIPVLLPPATRGTCDILHLELGPLDLDVLGLVVHLDKVVLDISAESGPGDLLGNLLCAIANLLNQNPLDLGSLADLLNQLLRLI